MSLTFRSGLVAGGCVLSLLCVTPGHAQTSNQSDDEPKLEEILVTATRTARPLQDVPLAVTALSDQIISETGVSRLDEYLRLVPGASFTPSGGVSGNLQIRGIATGSVQAQTQSTVSQFIDEFPSDDGAKAINTPDIGIFDVDRVELLRGPQGTLFGSGSISGAIRIVTKQPRLDRVEAAFEAEAGTIRNGGTDTAFSAMFNLPLVEDKIALRVVGYTREDDGWIEQVTLGQKDFNNNKSTGGRLLLKARLSDSWDATIGVYHQTRDAITSASLLNPTPNASDNDNSAEGLVNDSGDLENTFYNLKVNYTGQNFDFISVTTFRDNQMELVNDISAFSLLLTGGAAALPVPFLSLGDSTSFVQEFRATSKSDSPFDWTVGAFFLDGEREFVGSGDTDFPGLGLFNLFVSTVNADTQEAALYGEIGWQFAERYRLTLGGRWFSTESEGTSDFIAFGAPSPTVDVSQDETGFTPKIVLEYSANENVNIYASATQGFRTGDFNVVSAPGIPSSFDSDTLWNYELGVKAQFEDANLTTNLALFYIDWSDIQIAQRDPVTTVNFTGNAGEARSMGVELEWLWSPTSNTELGGSLAFLDAELTEDVPTVVQTGGVLGAFDGDRLPGTPDKTFSLFARQNFSLLGRNAFARADWQYTSEGFTDFDPANGVAYGSTQQANFSIGIDLNDNFDVSLYANNIFDRRDTFAAAPGTGTGVPFPVDLPVAFTLRPRTIGVILRGRY